MSSLWDSLADILDPPPKVEYQIDPVRWARERIQISPWSKQREILESIRDNHDTAVHSCHNAGKSFIAAVAACWWLDAHDPGTAFVVTTAPTGDQIKAILWREIGKMHKRGALPGRTNLTEWYIDGELVALGRKPNDYEPTAFQGIHAPYVLVIYDEACGIPETLWDAGSTLTSNDTGRQLAIGNPDDPFGKFARVCVPGSGWNVVHIAAEDTPNFTDEDVPAEVRASLISKNWAEQKGREWGLDSALYAAKVLGIFPADADNGVVPYSFVAKCRQLEWLAEGVKVGGLDVAGSDDGDRTVLQARQGRVAGKTKIWKEADPMVLVGSVIETINAWGLQKVVIDVIGIGHGMAGRLRELSRHHNPTSDLCTHSAEVISFNASERAIEPDKYYNRRAEIHWTVGRELSRTIGWDLSSLGDDVVAELCAARYTIVDSNGKIKVEPKADIKKRLGRSPDEADALLMAFWEPYGEPEMHVAEMIEARIPGVVRYR